jgi:hypothetical protein
VVPREATVRLRYGRDASDALGLALTLAAMAGAGAAALLRRRRKPAAVDPVIPADACEVPPPPRRWGAAVPAAVLIALFASRALALRHDAPLPLLPMYEAASRSYAEGRYADAAEYARHALARAAGSGLRPELLCLRGESLLLSGRPELAAEAFDAAWKEGTGPYVAQALSGSARAHAVAGDDAAAEAAKARLLREYGDTSWARRLP